jgi:inosine-uridine nucleoside N-ribohydrolase
VPVGPLTNIALAVEKDPSIVALVKEVVIMGGSINGGNVNASAEANIFNDPDAAQIVFQAGWDSLVMSGLEVGNKAVFTPRHLDQLAKTHGPINDFIYSVLKYLETLTQQFRGSDRHRLQPGQAPSDARRRRDPGRIYSRRDRGKSARLQRAQHPSRGPL